jgi:hypothetical protein
MGLIGRKNVSKAKLFIFVKAIQGRSIKADFISKSQGLHEHQSGSVFSNVLKYGLAIKVKKTKNDIRRP